MKILDTLSQKISKEFIKYCVSGGFGAFIQIFLTTALVNYFSFYYIPAAVISYVIALFTAFLLQRYWTFADRKNFNPLGVMTTLYILTSFFGMGLNVFLLYIFVQVLHFSILPADTISMAAVVITNYVLNSRITFKENTL